MQDKNAEQQLQANVGITREVGGRVPTESYVIQIVDDASGLLVVEARMDGMAFAKIVTGHIMTIPVRTASAEQRAHYGQHETRLTVDGFRVSSVHNSMSGQMWLQGVERWLEEQGYGTPETREDNVQRRGLVVTFSIWTDEPMAETERRRLHDEMPEVLRSIAKTEKTSNRFDLGA